MVAPRRNSFSPRKAGRWRKISERVCLKMAPRYSSFLGLHNQPQVGAFKSDTIISGRVEIWFLLHNQTHRATDSSFRKPEHFRGLIILAKCQPEANSCL